MSINPSSGAVQSRRLAAVSAFLALITLSVAPPAQAVAAAAPTMQIAPVVSAIIDASTRSTDSAAPTKAGFKKFGFRRHGFKGRGLKGRSFKGHGFKRHGFKHRGLHGRSFRGHRPFFGHRGFHRRGFIPRRSFHPRFHGPRRFGFRFRKFGVKKF